MINTTFLYNVPAKFQLAAQQRTNHPDEFSRMKKQIYLTNQNLMVSCMIEEIEESFVKRFIKKAKQDRLLFELSGKKRKHGIERFCHSAEDMINTERIIYSGNDLFPDEILKITKQYKVPESCYIIAYQKELDKKCISLVDALNLVLGNGMPALIICDDLVIIETEQCFGTPFRYILH